MILKLNRTAVLVLSKIPSYSHATSQLAPHFHCRFWVLQIREHKVVITLVVQEGWFLAQLSISPSPLIS